MDPLPLSLMNNAIEILGDDALSEEEIDQHMGRIHPDPLVVLRLTEWIPEAFAITLIPRLGHVELPQTFSAKNALGEWEIIPLTAEPIFSAALELAQQIMYNGPRSVFQRICSRSALMNVVNNALNAGAKLDGSTLSGPALISIRAETYTRQKHRTT